MSFSRTRTLKYQLIDIEEQALSKIAKFAEDFYPYFKSMAWEKKTGDAALGKDLAGRIKDIRIFLEQSLFSKAYDFIRAPEESFLELKDTIKAGMLLLHLEGGPSLVAVKVDKQNQLIHCFNLAESCGVRSFAPRDLRAYYSASLPYMSKSDYDLLMEQARISWA